jgi:hypothetical protein
VFAAVVIAIVKAGDFISSLYISLAVIYVVAMIFIVKPFLKRIGDLYGTKEYWKASNGFLSNLSSYATEVLNSCPLSFYDGVHYADVTKFRMIFIEKVEDVAVILLLPLFLCSRD